VTDLAVDTTETQDDPAALGHKRPPDENAPWGYRGDGVTPRNRPGRQTPTTQPTPAASGDERSVQVPPSLEDLRGNAPTGGREDVAPGRGNRRGRSRSKASVAGKAADTAPRPEAPPFRAGPIAKGVNRLYRRAGKLVRSFDPMLGAAIIATTEKDDVDDVTVGEAWEEIARTNVQVRVLLTKLITGGAWGQLFMCHTPILLALIMKDSIRQHLPFGNLLATVFEPDDTEPGSWGDAESMAAGQTMDMMFNQAAQMAAQMMARSGSVMPRAPQPGEVPEWYEGEEALLTNLDHPNGYPVE